MRESVKEGAKCLVTDCHGCQDDKKNSTPLSMLPSFLPSQRTRIGDEEIID